MIRPAPPAGRRSPRRQPLLVGAAAPRRRSSARRYRRRSDHLGAACRPAPRRRPGRNRASMARIASSLPGIGKVDAGRDRSCCRARRRPGCPACWLPATAMLLLVGVDDEQDVRQAAHLLDAAQRALELVALAGDAAGSPSWSGRWVSPSSRSSISRRRLIDCEIVFQLVSMPPSQRWLT